MEKLTQKWTLISLIETKEVGYTFSSDNWPLHVTIAATFEIVWDKSNTIEKLKDFCRSSKTFEARVLEDTHLGPSEKPVLVSLVEKSSGLQDFHEEIVNLLEAAGTVFKRPEHNGDKFIAHATVQKNARLKEDDIITINNLTLVNMLPDGDGYKRRISKVMMLGKPQI